MYTLFYSPFSCSFAVNIALEKINKKFESVKIDVRKGQHKTTEFLTLNSRGKVPLLQDGDQLIDQGAGILLYLADKHPGAHLIPPISSPERANAVSTLFYMSNTVHPTFAMLFYPDRFTLGTPSGVFDSAIVKAKEILTELNQGLENKYFLCGSNPYVADYYLITMLNWPPLFKINLEDYPNLISYKKRMGDQAEVSRAIEKEMTVF